MTVHSRGPLCDNAALLRAWRDGRDEMAFTHLCERHRNLVLKASHTFGSPDAEEAMQSVFMVLAQRPDAVGDPARLSGWLLGATRRVVANQRRVTTRRIRLEQCAMPRGEHLAPPTQEAPSWVDLRGHLDEAIAELSPLRRDALVRFYFQGCSQAQIAAELGCSVGSIKSRIHEALGKLRSILARRGVLSDIATLSSCLRE